MPIIVALIAGASLLFMLFFWSTSRSDAISIERQQQLVSYVLDQSAAKLAEQQEGVTLKDNAAAFLLERAFPEDQVEQRRVDGNYGPFLHTYYGHDESYLIDADDQPFYAMRNGDIVEAAGAFATISEAALPVVAELRAQMRRIPEDARLTGTPDAYDVTVVDGHPAILSAKPVVSPTGETWQDRGREIVQISVLRLDQGFLENLDEGYLFEDARFAWSAETRDSGEAAVPFVSPRTGETVGYFIWRPFAPGAAVRRDMAAPMLLSLLLVAAAIFLLVRRIARRTAELRASEAQARYLASHDPLTGLPNRALFDDRLDDAIAEARRDPARGMALLYIDLDHFKNINDSLGHQAGDEVIRELGRRLKAAVREYDTVARLGGDEFAVIRRGDHAKHAITDFCKRVLAATDMPFDVVGSQVFVKLSIGVARAGPDGFEKSELARKADIALYQAKHEGRGRFIAFTEDMDGTVQTRREIEQDLRTAMREGGQLEVHYQPCHDSASGNIVGAEALLRWHHPERGMMCPSLFIPIAEETGLIEPLGEWVLSEACRAAARWPVESVAINISGVQLRNPLFAARALKIARAAGIEPSRLEFEITETSFVENIELCSANLRKLRAAGVKIALDDFGTGFSSINHLRSFKVDRVKIDRSYVNGIPTLSDDSAIIQAIVNLARAAGLEITAEGVETAEQSDFLRAAGCDELQGFLMSRPMSGEKMDALLGVESEAPRRSSAAA